VAATRRLLGTCKLKQTLFFCASFVASIPRFLDSSIFGFLTFSVDFWIFGFLIFGGFKICHFAVRPFD